MEREKVIDAGKRFCEDQETCTKCSRVSEICITKRGQLLGTGEAIDEDKGFKEAEEYLINAGYLKSIKRTLKPVLRFIKAAAITAILILVICIAIELALWVLNWDFKIGSVVMIFGLFTLSTCLVEEGLRLEDEKDGRDN